MSEALSLRLGLNPEAVVRLHPLFLGRGGRLPRRLHLLSRYFDSRDDALAAAGLSLSLEHRQDHWVQCLESQDGEASSLRDCVERGPLRQGRKVLAVPPPSLSLHGERAEGEAMLRLLGKTRPVLLEQARAEFWRRSRQMQVEGSRLRLDLDEGELVAGEARQPLLELEITLLQGSRQDLQQLAQSLLETGGLWLDVRSRAQRALRLGQEQVAQPPRRARTLRLRPEMDLPEALLHMAGNCAEQIAQNASQIASSDYEPEHVHQLRVGLRRLRSGLSLMKQEPGWLPLAEEARSCCRMLGAVRDADVLSGAWAQALAEAAARAGCAVPALGSLAQASAGEPAHELVRGQRMQGFLLQLQLRLAPLQAAELERGPTPPGRVPALPPLERLLRKRLRRWQHRLDLGRDIGPLGVEQRHALRKHLRRLRYALEFAQALYRPAAIRAQLRALADAQELLGELNDLSLAVQRVRQLGDEAGRGFAQGWLQAQEPGLLKRARKALRRVHELPAAWNR